MNGGKNWGHCTSQKPLLVSHPQAAPCVLPQALGASEMTAPPTLAHPQKQMPRQGPQSCLPLLSLPHHSTLALCLIPEPVPGPIPVRHPQKKFGSPRYTCGTTVTPGKFSSYLSDVHLGCPTQGKRVFVFALYTPMMLIE